ncbi:MAG: FmdB family zinc ribbon protein [Bradymonadia bacterium]
MPIYKYRCPACDGITEVIAKISDAPPESCAHCGHDGLTKTVARTAFRLSGGGWYAQGYDGASNSSASTGGSSSASDD